MVILPSFYSDWRRQPQNKAYLLDWLKRVPLVWGSGMLIDHYRTASEFQVEASIRDYLYWLLNWTGTQDPSSLHNDSPVDLLRWQDAHKDANNGRGPEWSCAPYAAVYVGLLAAVGIMARRVWSSHHVTGAVDTVAEFWSSSAKKWVFVVLNTNTHFEWDGVRLSFVEWVHADRLGVGSYPVTITGNGAGRFYPENMKAWKGMSAHPCVARGNFPFAGCGDILTPDMWQLMAVLPRIGNAATLPPQKGGEPMILPYGSFDPRSITNAP